MNDTYITLTGWVGSPVTMRQAGGHQVAGFRVGCTSRRRRGDVWEDGPTTWYSVTAWRRLAEHVARSLSTGDPVVVHGRLVADVWQRPDGTVSTQLEVTATSVGHDLSHGTTMFTKPVREQARQEAQPAPQQPVPQQSAPEQPAASDPWAVPGTERVGAAQAATPTGEGDSRVDAA